MTEKEFTLPIKFNKELRRLSLEEATTLAQKGLKLESVERELSLLKDLAARQGKSLPDYINFLIEAYKEERKKNYLEKCGGDEELAQRLLESEKSIPSQSGIEELSESFPNIKSAEDLPQEVLNAMELKGTKPLDEYLRYLLAQKKRERESREQHKTASTASTGSLLSRNKTETEATEEFLKGLWN